MRCSSSSVGTSACTAAVAAAGAPWQRRLRRAVVAAAVQPERKPQTQPPPPPPAPTSGSQQQQQRQQQRQLQGVDIKLFETLGADPRPLAAAAAGPFASLLSSIDTSEPQSFDGEEKTEYDPLRDGPLRYLGYANECGEAFAAWLFPGGVTLSYAVAIAYVLFDTWDKWRATLGDARAKLGARDTPPGLDRERLITTIGLERGLDTLTWQLIASVAAPGYTIHTVVAAVAWGLRAGEEAAPAAGAALGAAVEGLGLGLSGEAFLMAFDKSVPTALGLLAIPFIVHPIDGAVHAVLNATLRPAMRRYICREAGGELAGLLICAGCRSSSSGSSSIDGDS